MKYVILAELDSEQYLCWGGLRLHWGPNKDADTEWLIEDQCVQPCYIVWHSCQLHPHQSCLLRDCCRNWPGENSVHEPLVQRHIKPDQIDQI